jgi:hypothetical protein
VLRMLNDGILELFSQIKILTIWKNAQRNEKGVMECTTGIRPYQVIYIHQMGFISVVQSGIPTWLFCNLLLDPRVA